MRTLLLGLPLKQAEAILGEAGHFSAGSRDRRAAPRKEGRRNIARRFRIGRRKTARCREIFGPDFRSATVNRQTRRVSSERRSAMPAF